MGDEASDLLAFVALALFIGAVMYGGIIVRMVLQ